MKELMKDLDRVYTELQHLDLQPTHQNILIMNDVLGTLKNAYNYIAGEAERASEVAEEVDEDVHS